MDIGAIDCSTLRQITAKNVDCSSSSSSANTNQQEKCLVFLTLLEKSISLSTASHFMHFA